MSNLIAALIGFGKTTIEESGIQLVKGVDCQVRAGGERLRILASSPCFNCRISFSLATLSSFSLSLSLPPVCLASFQFTGVIAEQDQPLNTALITLLSDIFRLVKGCLYTWQRDV